MCLTQRRSCGKLTFQNTYRHPEISLGFLVSPLVVISQKLNQIPSNWHHIYSSFRLFPSVCLYCLYCPELKGCPEWQSTSVFSLLIWIKTWPAPQLDSGNQIPAKHNKSFGSKSAVKWFCFLQHWLVTVWHRVKRYDSPRLDTWKTRGWGDFWSLSFGACLFSCNHQLWALHTHCGSSKFTELEMRNRPQFQGSLQLKTEGRGLILS